MLLSLLSLLFVIVGVELLLIPLSVPLRLHLPLVALFQKQPLVLSASLLLALPQPCLEQLQLLLHLLSHALLQKRRPGLGTFLLLALSQPYFQ